MGEDHRQRIFVLRPDMDEVDAKPIQFGPELRETVEHSLAPPPVVLGTPVIHQCREITELRSLRGVVDCLFLGVSCIAQPLFKSSIAALGMLILKGAISEDAGGKSIMETSLVAKAVADVANNAAPAAAVRLRNWRRVPWIPDAWIAMAFPPLSSIALTTAEAAPASFAYVMATLAPSSARRFAIAAPMPREPPVTIATLFANLDLDLLWSPETIHP
jgi:hypothetical protein